MSAVDETPDWTQKDACRFLSRNETVQSSDRIWAKIAKECLSREEELAMPIDQYRKWREKAFDGVLTMWHPVPSDMVGEKAGDLMLGLLIGRPI